MHCYSDPLLGAILRTGKDLIFGVSKFQSMAGGIHTIIPVMELATSFYPLGQMGRAGELG